MPPFGNSISTGEALSEIGTNTAPFRRLGSLPSSFLSNHRLRDASFEPPSPLVEGRSGNSSLEAEHLDFQAAGFVILKPLLPIQIVVKVAQWPSHIVSPKSAKYQHPSLHDLTSMDCSDAYAVGAVGRSATTYINSDCM